MPNGIELFTKTGRLMPLDQIEAQLTTPELVERFASVRAAHDAADAADSAVATCQESIKQAMAAVVDSTNILKKFPARSFLDEWRAHKATRAAE